jgi:predicted  nucleic acid-binding Zn-ribbon protein
MEAVKQITKEQLEKIVAQQNDLQALLTNIGILESQKHGLLHQIGELNKGIEEYKTELQNEYGAINISLEDGSYTLIETEEAEQVAAE